RTNQYAYVEGTGLTRWNGSAWVVEIAAATPTVTPVNFTSFFSTWTNYGSYTSARYYKYFSGIVHVEGMVRAGASSDDGEYIVVLPAGYRPSAASGHIFPVWCRQNGTEKACRVNINNLGRILPVQSGNFRATTGDWLSFSG